ncbi:MAG TPA: sulfotransferase domain-containing protein [Candidatus Eisenbacteria bacterium]|nr:sulfotransferase domain-containing protein [Candidatus Eisenbacteria bacterium]
MFGEFLRRRKYGEPVVVVSGLPRSGTSMMMKMLEAGGVPIMTDAIRQADVDNPKGYYEYERVKDLEKETDKTYVREGRGKALKVISFLLKELPDDNFYLVVFMRRHLDEVIASQNKMLDRRGESSIDDNERMAEAYRNHLASVKILVRKRPNFSMLEFRYDQAVKNPREAARLVNAFLGGRLDEAAMTAVVDAELYRNRKT